jgi:hypothetical protein
LIVTFTENNDTIRRGFGEMVEGIDDHTHVLPAFIAEFLQSHQYPDFEGFMGNIKGFSEGCGPPRTRVYIT